MARRRQYQANYEAAVSQYKLTVISAFRTVADTLVSLEEDAHTLAETHRAAEAKISVSWGTRNIELG